MRFRYINGFTCQILDDNLPFPFGRGGGRSPDVVVRVGDQIMLIRDLDYYKPIWNLIELKNEIINIEGSGKWRSEYRRLGTIRYYKQIVSIMTSYKRELIIDEVLSKYSYFDSFCLAC